MKKWQRLHSSIWPVWNAVRDDKMLQNAGDAVPMIHRSAFILPIDNEVFIFTLIVQTLDAILKRARQHIIVHQIDLRDAIVNVAPATATGSKKRSLLRC